MGKVYFTIVGTNHHFGQNFRPQHGKYTDWTAQIIQHELEHVDGIVI